MCRALSLQPVVTFLVAAAFLQYAEGKSLEEPGAAGMIRKILEPRLLESGASKYPAADACHLTNFQCTNGKCVNPAWFCDGANDCGDNSDEEYCTVDPSFRCPDGWTSCPNRRRCILAHWMCDGRTHCPDASEQAICDKKLELMSWFLRRRNPGPRADRWGSQVHRIAVALHLANNTVFLPGNVTGEEIRYELTLQLTRRLAKEKKISSQELALFIHALLVACMDPRDFYGDNLVRELRRRVEASGNYTDPFLVLALCNAGDTMTTRDVEKVTSAYDSQHRPFWIDSRALASMALSCIFSRSGLSVDERVLKDMLQELKRRQFRNGTVDNLRTTALVTQAMFIHDSFLKEFDLQSAIRVLINGLNGTKSLLTAYYALPVLHQRSLLNVTSGHCRKQPVEDDEALQKILDIDGETITVQYTVWMGDEINLARTWRLKVPANSTIYNAVETVAKIDSRQKVEYNVVDGKPFVAALNGKEDDPEMGMFWFVYLKTLNSDEEPMIVEESPVDVKLKSNQEIILWYKRGPWNVQNLMGKNATSF